MILGLRTVFLKTTESALLEKKDSTDYHREMNSHHFERWWENTVLNKLPDQSVVVIDNAKYHSRQTDSEVPTTDWRKAEFRNGWRREESVLTQRTQFLSCS